MRPGITHEARPGQAGLCGEGELKGGGEAGGRGGREEGQGGREGGGGRGGGGKWGGSSVSRVVCWPYMALAVGVEGPADGGQLLTNHQRPACMHQGGRDGGWAGACVHAVQGGGGCGCVEGSASGLCAHRRPPPASCPPPPPRTAFHRRTRTRPSPYPHLGAAAHGWKKTSQPLALNLSLSPLGQPPPLRPRPAPPPLRLTGGIVELFVLLGPSPEAVSRQYQSIVGRPAMPPRWALGMHQSK